MVFGRPHSTNNSTKCRYSRNFLVRSQNFLGLWLGPKELLLLMANNSGNATLYLCASPPTRETLALLSGFDLKQNRVQYRKWWEEWYESLKAKVS